MISRAAAASSRAAGSCELAPGHGRAFRAGQAPGGSPRDLVAREGADRCHTSTVVIAQLAYWVRSKVGRQRQSLQAWLTRLTDAMQGRIHGLHVSVVYVWADQEHRLEGIGRRMPVEDSYI